MSMMVISLTNSPAQLRGYLTRYLSEVQAGLFVGCCSARVRDALWLRVEDQLPEHGKAVLVYNDGNEQGYRIQYHNHKNKEVVMLDGLEVSATIDGGITKHDGSSSKTGHWSKAYWRRKCS